MEEANLVHVQTTRNEKETYLKDEPAVEDQRVKCEEVFDQLRPHEREVEGFAVPGFRSELTYRGRRLGVEGVLHQGTDSFTDRLNLGIDVPDGVQPEKRKEFEDTLLALSQVSGAALIGEEKRTEKIFGMYQFARNHFAEVVAAHDDTAEQVNQKVDALVDSIGLKDALVLEATGGASKDFPWEEVDKVAWRARDRVEAVSIEETPAAVDLAEVSAKLGEVKTKAAEMMVGVDELERQLAGAAEKVKMAEEGLKLEPTSKDGVKWIKENVSQVAEEWGVVDPEDVEELVNAVGYMAEMVRMSEQGRFLTDALTSFKTMLADVLMKMLGDRYEPTKNTLMSNIATKAQEAVGVADLVRSANEAIAKLTQLTATIGK